MHPALNRNAFFIKEQARVFKSSNQYEILDPNTQETLMLCQEPNLGGITKVLRFTDWKRYTPFEILLTTPDGQPVLTVKRGVSIFLSKVDVLDQDGRRIGGFKQKLLSIGGAFEVLDARDNPVCTLKGKWTSWEFTFLHGDVEYARVTKKWAGMAREMFTSADNYILEIGANVPADHPARLLIMAAVMCIDMVLKE
jgi:uncharacterized protein YxjI